ncbi:MAG: class I SAM-dependent methyltransferase [Promethearchaeota archaeon]|jgi:cyclopropane fatty-acyl-phospholipid synthase-like methyltransferase
MSNFRTLVDTTESRRKRYNYICKLVDLKPQHRVLDVGCGIGNSFEIYNKENEIIGLDLYPEQKIFQDNFQYIQGNGKDMSIFQDKEFDVVVCIGVLEHVFPFKTLKKMTIEIQRIGMAYIVGVPHMYTPIEQHYQLPYWQLYPDDFKSFLIKHFSIGCYEKNPEGEFFKLNYFKKNKWLSLFPGASVGSYRYLFGLFWSFFIYKKDDS